MKLCQSNLVPWWEKPGVLPTVNTEAALPRGPDQSGVGAGRRGWRQIVAAEWRAAHRSIHAGAVVFATSTETLAALVNAPIELAGAPLRFG